MESDASLQDCIQHIFAHFGQVLSSGWRGTRLGMTDDK